MSGMITARTPDELGARLDALVAAGAYESRAAVIVAALERLVAELEREADDRAIVEGYTRIPPTDDELPW
jgi:Arc/MetJ-type ribon-helix-helix transcriptional regulator